MAEAPPKAEGEAPPEISEQIEKLKAEGKYVCERCAAKGVITAFNDGLELGRHVNREHKEELKVEKAAEKATKKPAPPTPPEVYRGEPDATAILRDILETHPDVSEVAKNEVLSWAQYQPLNPQTVAWLLSQLKGISNQTANVVSQKYALALQKAQIEARPGIQVPIAPQLQPFQQPFQFPFGGYQPQQQFQFPQQAPWQQPQVPPQVPPPYQPYQPRPEKTYKLVVDGQEIETDEKGFMAWKTYLDDRKKTEGKPPVALTKDDVEEIKGDLAQALMEKLERDKTEREKETLSSMFAKSVERQDKLMEKIEKGELFPKVQPPAQPLVSPITKEDIAKAIEGSSKATREDILKFIEAKTKEEASEKRHSELLSAIRSGTAAQQVAGYKEDSYRLLGQGLTAMAGAVERKEPIKIVLEHAPQLLYGPATPGPKELAPGATGAEMAGVISKLEPEWVKEE